MDQEWTEKICRGDASAFELLFKKYCRQLISFSRRFVSDTQIAENVVQYVFVNVWLNREKLNPE